MSFAIGFVRLGEGQVKGDTIPKPVGLGSREPVRGIACSAIVRALFGSFPVSVRGLFGYIEGSFVA